MTGPIRDGDRVVLRHRKYGEIHGIAHRNSGSLPYVPLGFTHLTLGQRLADTGWRIVPSALSELRDLLDGWDVETDEATQADLVAQVRTLFGWEPELAVSDPQRRNGE